MQVTLFKNKYRTFKLKLYTGKWQMIYLTCQFQKFFMMDRYMYSMEIIYLLKIPVHSFFFLNSKLIYLTDSLPALHVWLLGSIKPTVSKTTQWYYCKFSPCLSFCIFFFKPQTWDNIFDSFFSLTAHDQFLSPLYSASQIFISSFHFS